MMIYLDANIVIYLVENHPTWEPKAAARLAAFRARGDLIATGDASRLDFPWVEFVHRGKSDCRYELRLREFGASGEVADIQVECVKCESKRRLSDAFSDEGKDELGKCRGRWPDLRKYEEEKCDGTQRAILLGASNSWFPIMLSVLSIPSTTDKLGQLVESNWAELEECQSAREVKLKRRLLKGLYAYSEDQIWEAVVKQKESSGKDDSESSDLRDPEWKVFSNPDPSLNSRDFKLRVVDRPRAYLKVLHKVGRRSPVGAQP